MRSSALHSLLATTLVIGGLAVGCSKKDPLADTGATEATGFYRLNLASPGGPLPFDVEVKRDADGELAGFLHNGTAERIPVPQCRIEDGRLVLEILHYDSTLTWPVERERGDGREEPIGTWRKRRGPEEWTEMKAYVDGPTPERSPEPEFPLVADFTPPASAADFAGRWRIDFESSEDPAVGIFEAGAPNEVHGTILTSTGDYRYLTGNAFGQSMRLSCFDGAHAFLFTARLSEDGSKIEGTFWSRDTWEESWTAVRDEAAKGLRDLDRQRDP